jgi:hypothetical protein
MFDHPEKVLHLSSFQGISGRILTGITGSRTRRVLYASVFVCALVVGATLTHRIFAKGHLRSIGGRMRAKLDALLRHLPHLSGQEFEDYVNGSVNGLPLHLVENHLRVCHVCKQEVDIVRQAMGDAEPGAAADGHAETAAQATQSFQWADDSTLWIDDAVYALKPVDETRKRVRVEGLAFDDLERMADEDTRVPGTHLVSIEGKGIEVIAPLSRLDIKRLSTPDDNIKREVPPTPSRQRGNRAVELLTDGQGTVFLSTYAPTPPRAIDA